MLVTDTTPFPGASTVYTRVYKLLAWMGRNGHVTITKSGRRRICHVSQEMKDLITALDKGDEQTLKATLLDHRYFGIIHEKENN